MKTFVALLGLAVIFSIGGCRAPQPDDSCTTDADCELGTRCVEELCRRNCTRDDHCASPERCIDLICDVPVDDDNGDGGPAGNGDAGHDGSDAGCEAALPTTSESAARFGALDVGAHYACASCHRGRSPTGSGSGWGPTSSSPTSADWHEAVRTLGARDSDDSVENTALYRYFNGANGTHPVNAAAREDIAAWLEYVRTPRAPDGCE